MHLKRLQKLKLFDRDKTSQMANYSHCYFYAIIFEQDICNDYFLRIRNVCLITYGKCDKSKAIFIGIYIKNSSEFPCTFY